MAVGSVTELTETSEHDVSGKEDVMRSYLGFVGFLFGFFAVMLVLEALLAAWWDLPAESMLPFTAAGALLVAPLVILRLRRPPLLQDGTKWSREHIVASSAVLGAAMLLFLLVWGLIVRERWTENFGWSAGGAAAVFLFMLVIGYVERSVRQHEARKRGIAPDDYRPGKRARRLLWTLAFILGVFVVLDFLVELTDALS
jgi:hypothetical protein